MRRWSCAGAAILAWLVAGPGWAAGALPAADDLARLGRDARGRGVAILLFFSQKDCPWCERARREYLLPLHEDSAAARRVVVREVDIDSDAPLTDFAGRPTRHADFARRQNVRMVPTVMVVDARGERAGEAIVGFRIADFYGAYIERAIEQGLARR